MAFLAVLLFFPMRGVTADATPLNINNKTKDKTSVEEDEELKTRVQRSELKRFSSDLSSLLFVLCPLSSVVSASLSFGISFFF